MESDIIEVWITRPRPVVMVQFEDKTGDVIRLNKIKIINETDGTERVAFVQSELLNTYIPLILMKIKKALDKNQDRIRIQCVAEDFDNFKMVYDFFVDEKMKMGFNFKTIQHEEIWSKKYRCKSCGVCNSCGKKFKKANKKFYKPVCPFCGSYMVTLTLFPASKQCPECGSKEYDRIKLNIFYTIMERKLIGR